MAINQEEMMCSVRSSVGATGISFCVLAVLSLSGCGGDGDGNVTSHTATIQILYSFGATTSDAVQPDSGVVRGRDGNFYGTTHQGGVSGKGAVFKITPTGVETVLYSFSGALPDGGNPTNVRLVEDNAGNFYGTTQLGPPFRMTPEGVVTLLPSVGPTSSAGLALGTDGNLYGTTVFGGAENLGTVFVLTPNGEATALYSFKSSGDVFRPTAALIQGSDGAFYGVCTLGAETHAIAPNDPGGPGGGLFKVTTAGVETMLHAFDGKPNDGSFNELMGPANLMKASDDSFYGTTYQGGPDNRGVVFKFTPGVGETILYAFRNGGAQSPAGGLIEGHDGNFYGATSEGGANSHGTLFQLTPQGRMTVIYSFVGGPGDGDTPNGYLVEGSDGSLYGTTSTGGASNQGTFFKLTRN